MAASGTVRARLGRRRSTCAGGEYHSENGDVDHLFQMAHAPAAVRPRLVRFLETPAESFRLSG